MNRKLLSVFMSVALLFASFGIAFATEAVTTSAASNFSDMPDNWSTAALNKAVENGLLTGYAEGGKKLIKAGNFLTRAEMATVVNRVFGSEKISDLSKVSDVSSSAWYAKDMAKAVKMGTFSYDRKMRPGDNITRQEAFTVLARAFKLVGTDANHKALNAFSDKDEIAAWALSSLDGMAAAGYIQGSDGMVKPTASITRAEFATVMDNLVKDYIDVAGDVTELVASGNVIVRAAGVTLKDVTVKGDLIIADGVGDGDVTLDNVKVEGRTVVRGGGENSIIIKGGSDVGRVIVAKVDGQVRIHVEGGAEVEVIYVDDGSDDVTVEGKFGNLEVACESITVYAKNAELNNATVSGNNSKIVVGDGSKVKDSNITGKSSVIEVDQGGSVDKVTISAPDASVSGKGEVKEVTVKAGGNNANISTPNTKTVVDKDVEGVKAGGASVEGGQTATNNATGTDATVSDTTSTGGGTSRPRVSDITLEALVERGDKIIDNYEYGFMMPFRYDDTIELILGTEADEAEIYCTLRGLEPSYLVKDTIEFGKVTGGKINLNAAEVFEQVFGEEDAKYGGQVVLEVRATKNGYRDRTEEFTLVFAAENVEVSSLTKSHYDAKDDLEFTISNLRPNSEVKVGIPILIRRGPNFMEWACDAQALDTMTGEVGEKYWVGNANEAGIVTVGGIVGDDLLYGRLCITLPRSGHVIDNYMELRSNGHSVRVGDPATINISDANLAVSDTNVAGVTKTVESNKLVATFAADSVELEYKVVSPAAIANLDAQVPGNQGEPGGGVLGTGYVGFQINAGEEAVTYVVYKNDRFIKTDDIDKNGNRVRIYVAIADKKKDNGDDIWIARIGEKTDWRFVFFDGEGFVTSAHKFVSVVELQENDI